MPHISKPDRLVFQAPRAPPAVLRELTENEEGQGRRRRRRRSTFDPSIAVEVTIQMDSHKTTYPYVYYKDPVVENFTDFESTKIIRPGNEEIIIEVSFVLTTQSCVIASLKKDTFENIMQKKKENAVTSISFLSHNVSMPTKDKFHSEQNTYEV